MTWRNTANSHIRSIRLSLDKSTQAQLERGRRLSRDFKTGSIPANGGGKPSFDWAATNGLLDDDAVERFETAERTFRFVRIPIRSYGHCGLKKSIDDDLKASLREAVNFKQTRWNRDAEQARRRNC